MMGKRYLILALTTLLFSCDTPTQQVIEKGEKQLTIFVASDSHLLSKNLISDDNQIYTKDKLTSDGRVQEYDYQLLEEYVEQINIHKPEYAFLTGDLTFNGEKSSHEEVVRILSNVKESKVLVIPGNHDLYNISPRSFVLDKLTYTETITDKDFKSIYEEFGYKGAISYDSESLSYFYKLDDNNYALMIDSNNTEYNYQFDTNIVGGSLTENTYLWIEENLKKARQENKNVISFMHHNLLVHNELFKDSYTLYNNHLLIELFEKYGVKINFSGHLHIQSIKENINGEHKMYDIASGGLLDYGNRYGKLDIYKSAYEYNSIRLSPSSINNFNDYSFDVFYDEYYKKSIGSNEYYFKDKAKEITDFASKVNAFYFDGDYVSIHQLKEENKKIARLIKRSKKHVYIAKMLELENENQDYLLIEK